MKDLPILSDLNIASQRVFLRADLNIPLTKQATIINNFKLQKVLPTINHIQQSGGKVILATHIGRPNAQSKTNFFDPQTSTACIAEWLEDNGYTVEYEQDLLNAVEKSNQNFSTILLLENLRFFNGEQGTDDERAALAELLFNLADLYVNDAFGLMHRQDTSITLLPQKFALKNRSTGMLVESELRHLTLLKERPSKPFVLVLGGKKIEDKTELLNQLLTAPEENRISTILLGGLLAHSFLQIQEPSLRLKVDAQVIAIAKEVIAKASSNNVSIYLPIDFVVKQNNTTQNKNINELTSESIIVDIGQNSVALFKKIISQAKTIFVNGTMGKYEDQTSQQGTKGILENVAANKEANSVIGGGDAVAACHVFNVADHMSFLSTGGGATLAVLAVRRLDDLPAIAALKN